MRIGFFCVTFAHLDMAQWLLESAKKCMPGVDVWHLTNGSCPSLPGVDGVLRVGGEMPMAVRRMSLQAQCEGEWLFVDTDIIIRKDVSDVFAREFDVAITDRVGTITNEVAYAKVMPYNIGVTFSRSPLFWAAVRTLLYTAPANFQEWEGDQRVVAEMMQTPHRFGFDVRILSGLIYNYPPRTADDPRMLEASICHYKGNRKCFLQRSA